SAAIADAVELGVAIAERVAKRCGLVDPRVLHENVRAAMKLTVRASSSLRIVIHPSQRATLSTFVADLQAEWPALGRAEIVEDETISPGGCRMHTAHGGIDADLRTQLDRIAAKLLPQRDGMCAGVASDGGGA
ncbi:MAG: FliH/SctL family protein, partial [Tepidisphaeraceae bacterium]